MDENYELIKKAQAGDSISLEILLEKFTPMIRSAIRGLFLTSGGDSNDIFVEGQLGFIQAVMDYSPEKNPSFFNYAKICVSNKARDIVRASLAGKHRAFNEALAIVSTENGESSLDVSVSAPDPLSTYLDAEKKNAFYSAAKEILSPLQFDVLSCYLDGYTYKEIAIKLSITDKKVDNALHQAREKIRQNAKKFIPLLS